MRLSSRLAAGLVAGGLALASPAGAVCVPGGDTTLTGAPARAAAIQTLGLPLPQGAEVRQLLQGGFQDRFIQIRIAEDWSDLPETLAARGVVGSWQGAPRHTGLRAAATPDWWQVERLGLGRRVPGASTGFANTDLVRGSDRRRTPSGPCFCLSGLTGAS